MPEQISRWINRIKERERKKNEAPYILEEYFAGGLNLDDEVARGLNIKTDEMILIRAEHES